VGRVSLGEGTAVVAVGAIDRRQRVVGRIIGKEVTVLVQRKGGGEF